MAGGGTAQSRGMAVHKQFDTIIDNGGAGRKITSETSYVNGAHDGRYRPRGSSNPDAVLGNVANPTAIYDLKTGVSGISNSQMSRYERNLPGGTPVYTIRLGGHDVPRPTTYSGVGAIGNAVFGGGSDGK